MCLFIRFPRITLEFPFYLKKKQSVDNLFYGVSSTYYVGCCGCVYILSITNKMSSSLCWVVALTWLNKENTMCIAMASAHIFIISLMFVLLPGQYIPVLMTKTGIQRRWAIVHI